MDSYPSLRTFSRGRRFAPATAFPAEAIGEKRDLAGSLYPDVASSGSAAAEVSGKGPQHSL